MVRVHPELLRSQQLLPPLVTDDVWKDRFEDITHYERYLFRDGTVVRKFFLNLSKKEQKKRFLARVDQPEKNWKFSAADIRERRFWDAHMTAYEDMNTSLGHQARSVVHHSCRQQAVHTGCSGGRCRRDPRGNGIALPRSRRGEAA